MSKKNTKKQLPDNETERNKLLMSAMRYRLLFLGAIVLASMVLITGRLYQVQIINQSVYRDKLIRYNVATINELPLRGEIIDRNGLVLSTNEELMDFIYIPPVGETVRSKWAKAQQFVELFDVDHSVMTSRDRKDAFIHYFSDLAKDLVTDEEYQQYRANELSDTDLYNLQLDRINDGHLARVRDQQYQVYMIYQKMHIVPGLIKDIKSDVTATEAAILIENSTSLTGFMLHPSTQRQVIQEHNLRHIIGSLTTPRQGLLEEDALYNQALNYNLTDQIGMSGLERTYENILSGKKLTYEVLYNDQGLPQLNLINEGENGATLRLTIDTEFQKAVEDIVQARHQEAINNRATDKIYGDRMFMVVSKAQTGEILAVVGSYLNSSGNFYFNNTGTYLEAYTPGSSIKGAMVYMGLEKDLFRAGETILDQPIKIQGTETKQSSAVLGYVDDIRALSVSSNVYMYNIIFRLGQARYEYDRPLNLKAGTFEALRKNFSQFGLGSHTGLDVPYESIGVKGTSPLAGNLLDYGTGQYDAYTTMQLNQYALTLANGGTRYQLHMVKDAIEPKSQQVVYQKEPQVLNVLSDPAAVGRVHLGMRACVTTGYCRPLNDTVVQTGAKTGTAQNYVFEDGKRISTSNSSLIAFAPYQEAEIAISCLAPHSSIRSGQYSGCIYATEDIINYYFSNPSDISN